MIDRVAGVGGALPAGQAKKPSAPSGESFGSLLEKAQGERRSQVNFSKHAMVRAEERGIELTPALMEQLAGTVEKAQEKGAKNIVAFNATQAFIINVQYSRVITTMNQDEMKENVFTNIDGAVLM